MLSTFFFKKITSCIMKEYHKWQMSYRRKQRWCTNSCLRALNVVKVPSWLRREQGSQNSAKCTSTPLWPPPGSSHVQLTESFYEVGSNVKATSSQQDSLVNTSNDLKTRIFGRVGERHDIPGRHGLRWEVGANRKCPSCALWLVLGCLYANPAQIIGCSSLVMMGA